VDTIDVRFNGQLDASTFTPDDLRLVHNEVEIPLPDSVTISEVGDTTYRIEGLSAITAGDGQYELSVDATGIQTPLGNAGINSLSESWIKDTIAPSSYLSPAAPYQTPTKAFEVTVQTHDSAFASGIARCVLYAAVDFGSWSTWITLPGDNLSAVYAGESGHAYHFRSVCTDTAGNLESKRDAPDTLVYVPDLDAPVTAVTQVIVDDTAGTFTIDVSGHDTGGGQLESVEVWAVVDDAVAQKVTTLAAGAADSEGAHHVSLRYQGIRDDRSHTYRFYSIGVDRDGNQETSPAVPADFEATRKFGVSRALEITGFDVQRGAQQRSYIRHLDLLFNDGGELQQLIDESRLRLTRFDQSGGGAGSDVPLVGGVVRAENQSLRFDFGVGGITGNPNSAAGNGYYELALDLGRNGFGGSDDALLHFYRLLGDATGDRRVDSRDGSLVVGSFGRFGSNLDADVNGDRYVNLLDRLHVIRQSGQSVAADLPLDD
jgi:hypothetical protein